MEDHIPDLLSRFQYSEQLRGNRRFPHSLRRRTCKPRIDGFGYSQWIHDSQLGPSLPSEDADGSANFTRHEASTKRDMVALKQRNEELEQTLQQTNLLILALNTMIETAEKELNVLIRKKSGTKRS